MTADMNIEKWLDLSAHGLTLSLVKVPSGKVFLAVLGESMAKYESAVLSLGYNRTPNNPKLMTREARFRDNGTLANAPNPEEWKKAFPEARVSTFDPDSNVIDRTKVDTRTVPSKPVQAGGRLVGLNSLGHEVYEQGDGTRYALNERKVALLETDADASQAGNFLRAADPTALHRCALGFVEQAERGAILRADDFARFVSVIHAPAKPKKAAIAEARAAVEAAAAAQVAKRGGKTIREAFIKASKLTEKLAFLSDGRGEPPMGPAAPMAMAAQRLLGLHADTADSRIVIDGLGAGHLLSHLPKGCTIVAGDRRPDALAGARAVASAAGLRSFLCGEESPAVRDATSVVLDLDGSPAPDEDGAHFDASLHINPDLLRIESALAARAPDGTAVFFLDEPRDEGARQEMERFRNHLSINYAFDGEARVDAGLYKGRPDAPARIMLAVGPRRADPSDTAFPPAPRHIHDWSTLWTWTAEVVSNRSRAETKVTQEGKSEVQFAKGDHTGNDYQAPYVSASKVGTPKTMVPRNLEGAMRESLGRLVRRADGDVDGWVAKEFGYSNEDLARLFSPEQIDALATYLGAEERGRGMLNADQMGVGKGRFLAAVMRRNALKGFNTIFNTEKQQNLSDIWRDIVHTESDHLIKPFFLNDGIQVIDERTKEVVHSSAPRDVVERVLASGAWPEGANLVLATYTQFTRKADKAPGDKELTLTDAKSEWLRKAVDRNVRLVMDECHNAASLVSNVSKNLQQAVAQADPCTVYSSATFAKGAEQMAFYAPLFPDGLSSAELTSMMQRGGETFQEVLSAMLVQDGVMVRREFDLSQLTYETIIDTPRFERNRAYMDAIAPVLFELVQLSGEVDRTLRNLNNANEAQAAQPNEAVAALPAPEGAEAPEAIGRDERRRRVKPFHLTRTGHGSPLYTISRLFVAALKVDASVEDAIASLHANKKPVIVVENTVQSLLEELAETEESAEGTVVADFRALFHRTLRQMTQARWKDSKQEMYRRDMTEASPALRTKVDKIKAMIDALPALPVSSIDEVKRRIHETGFTCDEITGRTLQVHNGRVMRRPASNPTVVKNAFNDGDVDAVIINAAGSTGIDLHASVRFKDRRQRRLIELQAPSDILRKIQGHGRVNRYDQVERPEIASILSGLPIELRLCAMENAKLRRLSANTTSNRDAAILTRNIPDLINPVGDIVCSRYAEVRPDLMRRLGFRIEDIQANASTNLVAERQSEDNLRDEITAGTNRRTETVRDEGSKVQDSRRTANEILARLIMLPVALQERVCNELTAEFQAAIEELEARGETPLKTHDLPGIVHPRERTVFDGADMENPDSVFHEPLYALEGALEKTGKPIKVDDLMEMIQIGEMASGRAQGCIDQLRSNLDEILEPFLPHGCPSVAEALEREKAIGGGEVTRRKARIEQLTGVIGDVKPGKELSYTLDGVVVKGIVTRVEYPDRGYEHVPSKYGVEFVIPGDERRRSMRLETMMKDPAFLVGEGLEGNHYDKILKDFENTTKVKLSNVQILTHNIYRAMRLNVEHRLGKLMTFVMNDGTRHRGVVVSKVHRTLKNAVPVELTNADMAWEALAQLKTDLVGSNTIEDKTFSMRLKGDTVEVRLPRKNSRMGFVYDDPIINGLLRLWTPTSKSASPRVTVSKVEARDILNALYETGAKFWCLPVHRDWATEWQKKNPTEQKAAEPRRKGKGRERPEAEEEAEPAMAMARA